jgi:GNAT superfamily N-acetyltransferase
VSGAIDWAARARAWQRAGREMACDELEPWEFGTIARARRYPDIYDLNVVIVERPTRLSVVELVAVADRELADSAHRKLDVEDLDEGRRLRGELETLGWRAMVLVWLIFMGPAPAEPDVAVQQVDYDALEHLRREWHAEDFPGDDPTAFHSQLRELALARGDRLLAVCEQGVPVAYAELSDRGHGCEVEEVFVSRAHRGRGLGTAVTTAAIREGLQTRPGDLWICADEEDRAWPLYERLGFRRVWRMMMFLRLPSQGPAPS